MDFLAQFGMLILIIVAISFVVQLLRQPIIIGYVLAGLLFAVFFGTQAGLSEQISLLAELGITFLLFLMGLEFDLKSLKYFGKDVLLVTVWQSAIFFGLGYLCAAVFGFTGNEKIYLAILFMFSSTLLAARWLGDKREQSTLHGKMVLGILIVQDIFAVIAITVLGMLQQQDLLTIGLAPLKGVLLLGIAFFLARYALNPVLRIASRFPELLFTFSISVCFFFVEIAPILGYSTTIGGFIGGIVLANTIYKTEIISRLKPLVLFFNMLFFVGLGFQMHIALDAHMIAFLVTMVAATLLLKPIVVYVTLRIRGYDPRTALSTGIYLSQLSEFGIIIVGTGIASGAIPAQLGAMSIIMVILSMILSSYGIKYDHQLTRILAPHIQKWDLFRLERSKAIAEIPPASILFFGYSELGQELMTKLHLLGKRMLVIEHDPENIAVLEREKIPHRYNSIYNPELFEHLRLDRAELIISNLTDTEANMLITKHAKAANAKVIVIVTARDPNDALTLYDHAADYVIYPSYINEQHVSILLEDYTTDINKVISKKVTEIMKLQERQRHIAATHRTKLSQDIDVFLSRLKQHRKPKTRDFRLDEFIEKA